MGSGASSSGGDPGPSARAAHPPPRLAPLPWRRCHGAVAREPPPGSAEPSATGAGAAGPHRHRPGPGGRGWGGGGAGSSCSDSCLGVGRVGGRPGHGRPPPQIRPQGNALLPLAPAAGPRPPGTGHGGAWGWRGPGPLHPPLPPHPPVSLCREQGPRAGPPGVAGLRQGGPGGATRGIQPVPCLFPGQEGTWRLPRECRACST